MERTAFVVQGASYLGLPTDEPRDPETDGEVERDRTAQQPGVKD